MTDDARHRVEQALLQMARLAAPTLPPAENAIIAELKRKYEASQPLAEAAHDDHRAEWATAAAA